MSWLAFPDLVVGLDDDTRKKLERAVRLSYCGHVRESENVFSQINESRQPAVFFYERATAYSTRGYYHDAEKAIQHARDLVVSVERDDSRYLFALAVRLEYCYLRILTRGHYASAFDEASDAQDEVRSWLQGRPSTALTEDKLEVILKYYAIVSAVNRVSNWASPMDLCILTDSTEGDHDAIREYLGPPSKLLYGCKLLWVMGTLPYERVTFVETWKEALEKLIDVFKTQVLNAKNRYEAVSFLLRSGAALRELSETYLARKCLDQSKDLISILSKDAVFCDDSSVFPSSDNDALISQMPWRDKFPRLAFMALALETRLNPGLQSDAFVKLADLAEAMDQRNWEKTHRLDARASAWSDYSSNSNPKTFATLKERDSQLDEMLKKSSHPSKQLQAMVLSTFASRPDSVTDSLVYSECKRFLSDLQGFDAPLHLHSLYSYSTNAATALHLPDSEIRDLRSQTALFYRQLPNIVRTTQLPRPESSEDSQAWIKTEIFLPDKDLNVREFVRAFERCLARMRMWATEQIKRGVLTTDRWIDIIFAHISPGNRVECLDQTDTDLRKSILGHFKERSDESTDAAFFAVNAATWLLWIATVQAWLTSSSYPEKDEYRHYVLVCLINIRRYTTGVDLVRAAGEGKFLYSAAKARLSENRRNLEIVESVQAGALDRHMARRAVLDDMCRLVYFGGTNEERSRQEQLLLEAQSTAIAGTVVSDPPETGWRMIQVANYKSAVKACSLRFDHFAANENVLIELFDLYDKVDGCVRDAYQLRTLFGSSEQLNQGGYTSIQAGNPDTVASVDSLEDPLRACTSILSGMSRDVGALMPIDVSASLGKLAFIEPVFWNTPWAILWQKFGLVGILAVSVAKAWEIYIRRSYTVDSLPSIERRVSLILRKLTSWIQRSKGRAMMELVKDTGAIEHGSLIDDASISETAKSLLSRERTLIVQINSTQMSGRLALVDELLKCRNKMLKEPDLAGIVQWRQATSASFDDIQDLLRQYDKPVVLIDWYEVDIRGERYVLFQPHRVGVRIMPDFNLGSATKRVQTLRDWRSQHLEGVKTPFQTTDAIEPLYSLGELVQPLVKITHPGETLIFCTCSTLQGIPLHAIQLDGKPLISRNPVIYIQSVAQARHALAQSARQIQPVQTSSFICTLEDDLANSETQPSELIATLRNELPDVKITGTTTRDVPLSKADALAALQHNDTSTILGHATFDAQAPMQSGYTLPSSSSGDSQPTRLRASDIFHAHVRPGAVVLQMGCGSGKSRVDTAGTHLGLDSALFFAGAATVVSTLWPIEYADAVDFVRIFYGAWKAESRAVREAEVDFALVMSATIKEMRGRKNRSSAFHWAPFVINGAWAGRSLAVERES